MSTNAGTFGEWSRFEALPPYFGGKRALCPVIFREIARVVPRTRWPHLTLLDGFCGGGAVSLYAKAQGMRVLANDLADRSRIIMDALIVNDRVRLCDEDLYRLFLGGSANDHFTEQQFVPAMFMQRHAAFIDTALAAIAEVTHRTKRQLLMLALVKFMLRITPYSQIHSVNYFQWVEEEEFHRLGRARTKKIPYTQMHPLKILQDCQRQINKAIFPNGHRNVAYQEDVFAFLSEATGDVCYLDPPYAGAQPYEQFYHVLDQVLAHQMIPLHISPFNSAEAQTFVQRLLEAARKFPLVILSYGSQRVSLEAFTALVRQVEPQATVYPVNLRYAIGSRSKQDSVRKELLAVIPHG